MNKNAIQKYAIWARNELIEQVRQRAYQYGVTDKGYGEENASVIGGRVLSAEEKYQRQSFVDLIKRNGFKQAIEEVAYTWFNRFVALRYMEVNDFLPTHVRVFSDASGNFNPEILKNVLHLDLEGLNKAKVSELLNANKTEELYRYLLLTQCNALNALLPEMFERMGAYTEMLLPNNILKPDSVLGRLVSDIIPEDTWRDGVQIIGWLYQYYNTEPKQAVFDALKKNVKITRENIPAATQLFTPDWIVRYMVENSLGRLWLESHPNSSLKSNWKYYLDEAEQTPEITERLRILRIENAVKSPEDIKIIDPCMGSGHILVYAFDVLMQIYTSEGYAERDAAKLILEKNIYGLEIDRRAYQLAYFALMMKARQYNRRILTMGVRPQNDHPASFGSTPQNDHPAAFSSTPPEEGNYYHATLGVRPQVYEPTGYEGGMEYGSLVRVEKLEPRPEPPKEKQMTLFDGSYAEKLNTWNFRRLLAQKYDVVVTNPPYMGSKGMTAKMSEYVKDEYPDSKSDLSTAFIEKTLVMCKSSGFMAMINIPVWMFLSSYEKLRENVLTQNTLINMLHFGRGVFGSDFGSTSFVISKRHWKGYVASYRRLFEKQGAVDNVEQKEKWFFEGMGAYAAVADNFARIPGSPVAYWVSEKMLRAFEVSEALKKCGDTRQGMATSDNNRFLRLWFEIRYDKLGLACATAKEAEGTDKKWFPYNKGGDFRKWYGNVDFAINYENDGFEVKQYAAELYKSVTRTIKSISEYFKPCLSWSKISSGSIAFRYYPKGFIFDVAGCCIFYTDEITMLYDFGFLNSTIAKAILEAISPTLNYEAGHIASLPLIRPKEKMPQVCDVTKLNIQLGKADWDAFETSWDFARHPLIPLPWRGASEGGGVVNTSCEVVTTSIGELPPRCLQQHPSEGGELGCVLVRNTRAYTELPFNPKLKERARELRKAGNLAEALLWLQLKQGQVNGWDFDRQKIIGNYIVDFYCANVGLVVEIDGSSHDDKQEYDAERDAYLEGLGLVVLHFTDIDVKKNVEGVVLGIKNYHPAASGGTPPKEGNQVAVAFAKWKREAAERFDTLKANEEELNRIFIDIYGLQDELTPEVEDKDVTVRRANLAREVRSLISYAVGCMFGRYSLCCDGLAYAGGEWDAGKYNTFPPDRDNILPICDDEYFDDDIAGHFVEFVRVVYGADTLEENLKFIADALGGTGTPREVIRKYFLNGFYADHLKIYQKRPIYWLFESGKKNGFKALMYMHRYSQDLLAKLRTDYVHEQQERYRTQLSHIVAALNTASGTERARLLKQQDKLTEQAKEIGVYEEKVHHLADMNIAIDLDDGVKKNYAVFEDVLAKI